MPSPPPIMTCPSAAAPVVPAPMSFVLNQNIVLNQELPWITSEITVEGFGYTISGNERFRHFNIDGGRLTIRNMALTDGHHAAWGRLHPPAIGRTHNR